MKFGWIIRILYFDEDHRSFMIVVGFWKNIGSLYFLIYTGDFVFRV